MISRHQLRIGHSLTYQMQETEFQHDELDRYNWNYLDQHISGIQDFAEMVEVSILKFPTNECGLLQQILL